MAKCASFFKFLHKYCHFHDNNDNDNNWEVPEE